MIIALCSFKWRALFYPYLRSKFTTYKILGIGEWVIMITELQIHEKVKQPENEVIVQQPQAVETLFVNEFIDGILDPQQKMLGPVKDGGMIIANTTPGCWGPMLTPRIRGGHEVTKPIFVEGAEVGDAIAITIKSIQVTSLATSSGHDEAIIDRFIGDPFVSVKCPGCGKLHPSTVVKGIGPQAIRCSTCDTETSPFKMTNGYTMALDQKGNIGVTVGREGARRIALDAKNYMRTPENSVQNPAVALAPSDLIGIMARMRPFLGQLGTTPSKRCQTPIMLVILGRF